MPMIQIKHNNKSSRPIIEYLDTDDLNQNDFYEFCRLQDEGKYFDAIEFIKSKLLYR